MDNIEELFQSEPTAWLEALEPYQRRLVDELLKTQPNHLESAKMWLSASTSQTVTFGSGKGEGSGLYLDKVVDEIEKLLCGDPKYKTDRTKIFGAAKPLHAYVVGAIAVAIAPALGSSAVVLAPVVALVLMSMGKCALNAWCETRKASKAIDNTSK